MLNCIGFHVMQCTDVQLETELSTESRFDVYLFVQIMQEVMKTIKEVLINRVHAKIVYSAVFGQTGSRASNALCSIREHCSIVIHQGLKVHSDLGEFSYH